MTEILRQKLLKLVRGDDGVALVVTLALFMFLYVSCAGVYTVGRAVKDRIILQNAVDAAAYSAAVVQADYLSRIATINKAMAWTYKSLVSSQMDWIASKTLSASYARYLENMPNAQWIGVDRVSVNTMGIVAGSDAPRKSLYTQVAADLLKVEDEGELRSRILEYSNRLDGMNRAISDLWENMSKEIRDTAQETLKANLPERLGELCRQRVSFSSPDDYRDRDFSDEGSFVALAHESNEKFADQDWFALIAESSSFERSFAGGFKTFWQWQRREIPYDIVSESFDAENFRSELPEAYLGFSAEPFVLRVEDYFARGNPNDEVGFRPAKGAITIAVAKWNENPWKSLVRDLTGIHAAFDYGEKNDWTFAISSAQAGYRSEGDDSKGEAREYSLAGEGFTDNLSETDWDAVHIPVRMAFTKVGFASWMKNGAEWNPLVPTSEREYVDEPLQTLRSYELNHEALARMHNSGGAERVLEWNTDSVKDFLDLMYH